MLDKNVLADQLEKIDSTEEKFTFYSEKKKLSQNLITNIIEQIEKKKLLK